MGLRGGQCRVPKHDGRGLWIAATHATVPSTSPLSAVVIYMQEEHQQHLVTAMIVMTAVAVILLIMYIECQLGLCGNLSLYAVHYKQQQLSSCCKSTIMVNSGFVSLLGKLSCLLI